MRLTSEQIQTIKQATAEIFGEAGRLSARISRSMQGRRVDVLVQAPGINEQPIQRIARREGIAFLSPRRAA